VLHSLQGSRENLDTAALARGIATWEAADTVVGPTEFAVDAVTVSLHHTHFPKLVDAGLLVYDATRDRADLGERTLADLLLDDELRLERDSVLTASR
jgi:hypothetical protein